MKMTILDVIIFDSEHANEEIPESPEDFLEFWRQKFDKIPPEYRSSGNIEMEAEQIYDVPYVKILVSYKRPENKEEEEYRKNKEKRIQDDIKEREIRELKRLKEKYGDVL